jgi:transcription antitermination factor NusG
VGGRSGPGSPVSVVADRATRPVERLCEFARSRRSGFRANAHRAGAGRRRVRQREQSHLHPETTRGAERDPGQARKENLAHSWSARPNAASISATPLPAPILDREPVQFGETQTLGSCAGPLAAHAKASSPAARIEFQSVSPEASLPFLKDVNRAKPHLSGTGEAITTSNTKSPDVIPDRLSASIPEQWFAAYTLSCHEKRVAQHLSTRHIEFFLPVQRKINRWRNGLRMLIERPLFPGYVFVKIDGKERVRVLELPGVHSLVGAGREPTPLPYEEIEALRRGMHLVNAEPHPILKSGEKVLICKGPLEGMTGIVVREKNSTRVILTLDLIMKSISVEVAGQEVGNRWSRSGNIWMHPFSGFIVRRYSPLSRSLRQ